MNEETVMVNPAQNKDALVRVASLIRPLPDNVTPSEEFLRRTRLRLLRLQTRRRSPGKQAA